MAKVPGAEPAVAKGFRIGLWVLVIAGKDGGADHATPSALSGRQFAALTVPYLDLDPGAGMATGADADVWTFPGFVQMGGQDGDCAGTSARPVILHQHLAKRVQRFLLIAP